MTDVSPKELFLALPGGRTLAYEASGITSSSEVVIFFHGTFSVGLAPDTLSPALEAKKIHFIAPTLPGWGNTSAVPAGVQFHDQLYEDTTALIEHLHPNDESLKLYIAGGSFGTIPAQIIYGAPYDKFPLGRRIQGMLLLAPFSPFRVHKEYTKCLSWGNYFLVGPPCCIVPFKLVPRVVTFLVRRMGLADTPEHANEFMRKFVFTDMSPEEKRLCEEWKAKKGIKDGEEVKSMANGVYRSVQKSWVGFMSGPEILHSSWGGYSPADLDEEHSKPVLLFLTKHDRQATQMGEWLAGKLKNARIRYGEGGHVGALFVMDDIWEDFMSQFP